MIFQAVLRPVFPPQTWVCPPFSHLPKWQIKPSGRRQLDRPGGAGGGGGGEERGAYKKGTKERYIEELKTMEKWWGGGRRVKVDGKSGRGHKGIKQWERVGLNLVSFDWHASFTDFFHKAPTRRCIVIGKLLFSNDRNRFRWVVIDLPQDGACTDLFENLSVNGLKGARPI